MKKLYTYIGLIATAAASLLLSSCRDERHVVSVVDDNVRFSIVDDRFVATRSSDEGDAGEVGEKLMNKKIMEVQLPIEGKSVAVNFSEEKYDGSEVFAAGPQTRGETYVTETVTTFRLNACKADGTYFFDQPQTLSVNDRKASATFLWPDQNLTFFADYVPEAKISDLTYGNDDEIPSGSFSYALPAPTENGTDPLNQKDMIFAITPDVTKASAKTDPIPLRFHHALSAVMFKVGTMPAGVTLQSIQLVNFHSSGTCTFGMKPDPSQDKPNDVLFSWVVTDDLKTYSQALNNQAAADGDFMTGQVGNKTGSGEYTFMMIPQKFEGASAKLVLKFNVYGKDYTLEKNMSDIIASFYADTKYVIRIGINEVKVEIEEEFDQKAKENVYLRNTGNSNGYIRAALVGYWVNEKENGLSDIMVPWRDDDGIFVWGTNWDTYWVKGTDGFYYHKQVVAPGAKTAIPLFQSYTLTSASPIAGARLVVNVVAQIVAEGCIDQAWPDHPSFE